MPPCPPPPGGMYISKYSYKGELLTLNSEEYLFTEIAEKEKNGKKNPIPFVEPSAGVQEFQQSDLLA